VSLVHTLGPIEWALIGLSGLLIGMNKAGLMGTATAAIPIMAGIFGAQPSVGIILPMLITADVVAVAYYRRHADWGIVLRLLPWALVGVGVGVVVGDLIPASAFRTLLAGFATMVGNAAGPITTLYLLSMGLSKNQFIGTGAWFFFVVNVLKVPLHVIFWGTITVETLAVNLFAVPVIIVGGFLGLWLVRFIKERPYRVFILVITAVMSVRLFF